MDTPVLISHKTAWLVHHAPQNLVQSLARHDYQIGAQGISTQQRVARIRQALTDCGIPSDMLKTIDIAVVFEFERIRTKGVVCHILGQNLPYEHINELTPGIFITDEAFTFVLAAEWMDRIEYLEYGYEVCGDYRMRLNPADPYTGQPATTSKDEITKLLDRHPGKPGATRARLALRHIYDHSASPMETASAIALSLPTSMPSLPISAGSSVSNIRAVFTMSSSAREQMRSEKPFSPKWDIESLRSLRLSSAASSPFTVP